ncbi:MAG: hypothetical protein HWE39_04635 [Oceanospirillaceae bacterium]|nr:hypothetical protein [Oceanospirillaceae bacterium]
MKFSKAHKAFVTDWIDHQFASNPMFPCNCASVVDGEAHVCTSHIKAYKAWKKTPFKRSHIREWIDEWLNPVEIEALQMALKEHEIALGEAESVE